MKSLINTKALLKTTLLVPFMAGCSWNATNKQGLGMMEGPSTTSDEEQWEPFLRLMDDADELSEITGFLDQHQDFVNSKHRCTKDADYTPLHYAAEQGDLEILKALIARGAEVNVKTTVKGRTPLHLAAMYGHRDIAEYLVKQAKAKDLLDNVQGGRALHYATGSGRLDVVECLFEALEERGEETNPKG